jgi:hypothetical protein
MVTKSLAQNLLLDHRRAGGWQRITTVLLNNYTNPDLPAARIILSAVAAHAIKKYCPAWLLAIAPPGSAKTDLLESLRGLPTVQFVDEITRNTFLSGKLDEPGAKRSIPASLLHRIGKDGILVAADFSTYTSDAKLFKVVMAQLRRIYDGNYSREFGTTEHPEERHWDGRLTLLAGAVPDVDRHHQLFQSLGERFVRVRWPRAGGVAAGLQAMAHTDELALELKRTVRDLLLPIIQTKENIIIPTLAPEMLERISALSELAALGRSHVERDRFDRSVVIGVPVTEGNTRLPQQLAQLGRGSALVDGRDNVNEEDFRLLVRAALDSIPPARRAVLVALIRGESPYKIRLPESTAHYALGDLHEVRLVDGVGQNTSSRLTETATQLLWQAAITGDLLSHKGD